MTKTSIDVAIRAVRLEVQSTACFCGRHKLSGASLCTGCHFALPRQMRDPFFGVEDQDWPRVYEEVKDWLRSNTTRVKSGGDAK